MSLKSLLFGKTESAQEATNRALTPAQRQLLQLQQQTQREGIAGLKSAYADPTGTARRQVQSGLRGLGQERADTSRRLSDIIAQRGLGQSSIGISQQRGLDQGIARRGQELRASLPDRIRQLQLQKSQGLLGASRGINLGPQFQRETKPGLAGLLGTVGGGFAGNLFGGGPLGKMVGSKIGGGIGQGLSAQFGR